MLFPLQKPQPLFDLLCNLVKGDEEMSESLALTLPKNNSITNIILESLKMSGQGLGGSSTQF